MGGIGNVVVNTIVRMFTRKAVSKAMESSKKGKASRGSGKKRNAKSKRDSD